MMSFAGAGAAGVLVEDDFSTWPDRQWTLPGTWAENGWRLYGSAGSAGSLRVMDLAEGRVLRMTRTNTAGDGAIDAWDDDKRLLVPASSTVFVRAWARQVGSAATLRVSLHEFNGGAYTTGLENSHLFPLTADFAPYSFQITLAGSTTEISPGFRVQGTGVVDLQRIEVVRVEPTLTWIDDDFSSWAPLNAVLPGMWLSEGWRLFGVGGAAGQFQLISTTEGPALRMSWTNSSGDMALDRDLDGLRLLAAPGTPMKFRIRARRLGGSTNLRVTMAEYDRTPAFTGVESTQVITLTNAFADYEYTVTPSAGAYWLNPALRVEGIGSVELRSVKLVHGSLVRPTIDLPQGWTPNAEPILYWRAPAHEGLQVQTAEDVDFTTLVHDTGALADARDHRQLPLMTAGERRFARVRVRDFAGVWSDWSAPTLIHYAPPAQAAAGTLQVYDLGATRNLTPAEAWEQAHVVAAIAGLANRTQSRLYVRYMDSDDYWLGKLREEGRWLQKMSPFHLGASQGYFRKISAGLEINRANAIGDTAMDRYSTGQHITVPPSTALTLKVWARTVSGTNRIRLGLDEFSGAGEVPIRSVGQVFTLNSSFQTVSYPITTLGTTDGLSPSIRVDGIGTLQIQRIEVVGTSNGQTYFVEDFSEWASLDESLPGHWTHHDWRIFGTTNPTIEMLVNKFPDVCTGVVLYDPNVPATSCVASTIAGADGLIPIPLRDVAGSMYRRLVTGGPRLPVVVNLVGKFTGSGTIPDINEPSTGSAKNDAYRWALRRYLETGKCDPAVLANYIDYAWVGYPERGGDYSNSTVINHDFFIKSKAFFFDLSVWGDEKPNDDPGQPLGTDKATLKQILATAAPLVPEGECIHVGGFVPWAFKYVSPYGTHAGVESEWESVRIFSNYNAYIDADALGLSGMANAALYALMPKVQGYVQPPPPRVDETQAAGWLNPQGVVAANNYYANYIGDYDSAAWVMSQLPARWDSRHRGREVLSWAWGPQLMRRGAPMFDSYVREATGQDSIWAADNGAGYLNPTQLTVPRSESGLPDGTARWQAYCAQWYRRMGIRHSGFVIDGGASRITTAQESMYEKFSGDGMVTQWNGSPNHAPRMNGTLPIVDNALNELGSDPVAAAGAIASAGAGSGEHRFIVARSILKPTDFYYDVDRSLRRDYTDKRMVRLPPSTFFYLMRHDLGSRNHLRASVLVNLPGSTPKTGRPFKGTVYVRNIGWEVWPAAGTHAVRLGLECTTTDARQGPQLLNLPHDVYPGELVALEYTLTAPATAGTYYLRTDLQQDLTWFSDRGNLVHSQPIGVETAPVVESAVAQWFLFQ